MLIIAIPKSASTSLMKTLGQLHQLPAQQEYQLDTLAAPAGSRVLHQYHSDMGELTLAEVDKWTAADQIFKQHVFPSPNNLALLRDHPKVVLLRDPEEIALAYRRGAHKRVHPLLNGFTLEMSETEWLAQARRIGLLADLDAFTERWLEHSLPDKTLFLRYEDYVANPKASINAAERVFGLPITQESVTAAKARYSRDSSALIWWKQQRLAWNKRILQLLDQTGLRAVLRKSKEALLSKRSDR